MAKIVIRKKKQPAKANSMDKKGFMKEYDKQKMEEGSMLEDRLEQGMKDEADRKMDPKNPTSLDKKAFMKEYDKKKKKLRIYKK